jgi:hypothetical protein
MIRSLTRRETRNRRLVLALLIRATASRAAARAWGIVFRDQLKFHFAAEQAAMWPQVRAKLTSEPHGQALLDADPAAAIGQHGVWGGLVAADRAQLRRRLAVGYTGGSGLAAGPHDDAAIMSRVCR